jgi:hypothetical protein
MATKRVIVLNESYSESSVNYSGLFWFPITSAVKTQTAGSAWVPSGASVGAVTAENTAIQGGTIAEVSWSFTFPIGTPVATIESVLQQAWTSKNAQINGIGPNQFYGSFWDGVAWSNS